MPKTKKSSTKKTHIVYVIDRSGSMQPIWQAALDGLNENLNSVRQDPTAGGETDVSVVVFDQHVDVVAEGVPADMIQNFTSEDFFPSGTTALYDAIKAAVELIKDELETDDTGYLVTVISDGQENASTTRQEEISATIKNLEATGKWTFNFMLANQDIHSFVRAMGVHAGNVADFSNTFGGTQGAFSKMSVANASYLASRGKGMTSRVDTYSSTVTDGSVVTK